MLIAVYLYLPFRIKNFAFFFLLIVSQHKTFSVENTNSKDKLFITSLLGAVFSQVFGH